MKEILHTSFFDNKPAILFVTGSLDAGGAETHILSVVSSLMQDGYFVAVASRGGMLAEELRRRGILHLTMPLDKKNPFALFRASRMIRRYTKKYGFSILHAHTRLAALACRMSLGLLSKPPYLKKGRRDGVRFVTTAHLDFKLTPLSRRFGYWGEKTLAVSEDIREYLIQNYHLPYESISLTVNGIDTDRFYKKDCPTAVSLTEQETTELVHVSRIDKDRALVAFLLIALMPKLVKRHDVYLTIVGGGELFEELQKRADRVNKLIGERIRLTGPKEDVLPYLKRADIAIGVSRAALEAMSCSLPTVLAGNDGYLGIFEEKKLARAGYSNFCCRGEGEVKESTLGRDIELLITDRQRRNRCGEEARRCVVEHYSLERMTAAYRSLYDSLQPYRREKYNRHLILGYHGFGNVGDDAVLAQMIDGIRKIDPSRGITVITQNIKLTEQNHAVRAVSRKNPFSLLRALLSCDILYVGGGTLLQSKTSHRSLRFYLFFTCLAKLFKKTVVYWSNGIGELSEKEQPKVAKLLSTQSVISLRDELSYYKTVALLGQIPEKKRHFWREDLRTRFVIRSADSGILTEACSAYHRDSLLGEYRRHPYFVVSTNGCLSKKLRRRAEKALFTSLLSACEKGLLPIFLIMHPKKDKRSAERLVKRLEKNGYPSLTLLPTPKEAVGVIERAEFVVSSRYHPLVFAAKCHVPALAYSVDEKCLHFAETVFGNEAACRIEKGKNTHFEEAVLSLLIIKTLPQETALFKPSERVVAAMTADAEALPDKIDAALIDAALQKKKEPEFLRLLFDRRRKHS